jgi:hypothetical protein
MTKRRLLFAYQLLTGLSDTSTGLLLIAAPAFTLHLMHLRAAGDTLPYLSYIGAFVLSTGLACFYGALLTTRPALTSKLEVVWLLTAITRGVVALFVITKVAAGALESGWITVAISDGILALLQIIGLARGWLSDAAK